MSPYRSGNNAYRLDFWIAIVVPLPHRSRFDPGGYRTVRLHVELKVARPTWNGRGDPGSDRGFWRWRFATHDGRTFLGTDADIVLLSAWLGPRIGRVRDGPVHPGWVAEFEHFVMLPGLYQLADPDDPALANDQAWRDLQVVSLGRTRAELSRTYGPQPADPRSTAAWLRGYLERMS